MEERLRQLGWCDIEVVDDDLGRSAAGTVTRDGLERMVAEVCLGKVGAVAAREAVNELVAMQPGFLHRPQGVDRVCGSGTRCGQRRCQKRQKHNDQNTRTVDQRVGCAHIEKKETDQLGSSNRAKHAEDAA